MSILSALSGGLLSGAADIIGKFVGDPDKAAEINLELEKLVHTRTTEEEKTLRTTMRARERVMVAELNQSDNYTKRARPTTVYFGLIVIAFNYCLVPLIMLFKDMDIQPFMLPTEFWMAWGGVVATWSIGRSVEKFGIHNNATTMITGNKPKVNAKKADSDDFWDDVSD